MGTLCPPLGGIGLKEGPEKWFVVKTNNVIMSNHKIDMSFDLKQKQFCYGAGIGDPPWAPRL